MRCLVTGAGGFIGKFLVTDLIRRGDQVIAVGRSPSPFRQHPALNYVRADVSDFLEMNDVFLEYKPEIVFHLASLIADECEADPSAALSVNVKGTQGLMHLASAHGVKRFVFMSSQSVYDPDAREPVSEEQAGHPLLLYGITKYYGEMIGLWYARKGLLDFRALRPSVVFGPTRYKGPSAEFSSLIIERALRGEKVVVKNPDDRVNYLYVRDAVEAAVKLAFAERAPSRVYNAGGFTTTVMGFIQEVKRFVPSLEYEITRSETVRYPSVIDNSRAQTELGWSPRYGLKESIGDYIATLKKGEELFSV